MATAAAFGDALGLPGVRGVQSRCDRRRRGARTSVLPEVDPDSELLVVTRRSLAARCTGHATVDGRRIDGPNVSKPAKLDPVQATAIAGSASHVDLFDLPVLPIETPSPAGLVRAAAAELLAPRSYRNR